jgi:hypothetical protein
MKTFCGFLQFPILLLKRLSEDLVPVSPSTGSLSRFHVVRLDAVSAGLRSRIPSVCDLPSTLFLNGKTDVKRGYRGFEQNTVFTAHRVHIITYVICTSMPTRETKGVITESNAM